MFFTCESDSAEGEVLPNYSEGKEKGCGEKRTCQRLVFESGCLEPRILVLYCRCYHDSGSVSPSLLYDLVRIRREFKGCVKLKVYASFHYRMEKPNNIYTTIWGLTL
ncbi:hypothetical protein V8G54_018591 [Vigna mungo]|uniref:Uncharacterized protein n=1 Tax=Vigna mungo TaxID=3915 RepID=A0AAQ3NA56_VIGMU